MKMRAKITPETVLLLQILKERRATVQAKLGADDGFLCQYQRRDLIERLAELDMQLQMVAAHEAPRCLVEFDLQ